MSFHAQLAGGIALLLGAAAAWASSVFCLPGNWISLLLVTLYGWWEGFDIVRPWVLLAGLGLCALGEALEFVSGYFGARRSGASRWGGFFAMLGAIAGAFLGAVFGYGLGAIPGTVLGAFAAALAVEIYRQRHTGKALRAGIGAAIGRALGLASKLSSGAAFLALLTVRVIWALAGVLSRTPPGP